MVINGILFLLWLGLIYHTWLDFKDDWFAVAFFGSTFALLFCTAALLIHAILSFWVSK